MALQVNGAPRECPEGTTLSDLLKLLAIPSTRGLAVAVNDQVVPRDQWDRTALNSGGRITVIRATQGG